PNGDIAFIIIDASATEKAWQYYEEGAPKVTEAVIAEGLEASKRWIAESIDLQLELVQKAGVHEPIPYEPQLDYGDDVFERVAAVGTDLPDKATRIADKTERNKATDEATAAIMEQLPPEFAGREGEIKAAVRSLTKKVVRRRIVRDLRPVSAQVGLIPTAHGSGLFQRGETQVLNVSTLGMPRMDQLLDTIGTDDRKRYMHHYNMPP